MTAPWSPRDERADLNPRAPRTFDRPRRALDRARTAVSAWPARRTAIVSSALALTLVGGLAVAATTTTGDEVEESALAALSLEAAPLATQDPVVVPEDAEWTVDAAGAQASVHKAEVPTIREAHAASRAAQRQALAEAANAAAEAEAAQARAAQPRDAAQPRAVAPAPAAAEPQAAAQAPAVNAAAGSERGALASMLNSYRSQNGVGALTRDPQLDQVAQSWAQWMASNQVLQHNPNYRSQAGPGWAFVSENIVRNTGGASMSPDAIVSWMFGWWQNSSVHRDNMLNARHTHVGIGYVMGAGGPYAVQLFGTR